MATKWNSKSAIAAETLATTDVMPLSDESQSVGSKDRTITVLEARKGIGGVTGTVQNKTGTYALTDADVGDVFTVSGTWTLTLPDSMVDGYSVLVILNAAGTVTLSAATTLNSTKTTLTTVDEAALLVHVGSDVWHAMFLT